VFSGGGVGEKTSWWGFQMRGNQAPWNSSQPETFHNNVCLTPGIFQVPFAEKRVS